MEGIIQELESIFYQRKELAAQDKEPETTEKELRETLKELMLAEGIGKKRTDRTLIYTSETKDLELTDEVSSRGWLQNHGLLEECLTLNKVKAKSIAKKNPDMPGWSPTTRTTITLKPIEEEKPAMEEMEGFETPAQMRERINNIRNQE